MEMQRFGALLSRLSWLFLVLLNFATGPACAQTPTLAPNVQKGVAWLGAQIQNDGSLAGESNSIATTLQARQETQLTLTALSSVPSTLAAAVAANTDGNVEYGARRVWVGFGSTQNAGASALLAQQNADGGWGLSPTYQSDPLDTAFVLQALAAAQSGASPAIGNALVYLNQAKLADGGWGVDATSTVYVTSYVLLAANAWSTQFSASSATVTGAATTWLLAQRNSTTQAYPTILEDAIALHALATQASASAALPALASALDAAQLADGSWADDPYLTAVALFARWYTSLPPPPPTTGIVNGTVIDQSTGQPLSGVAVSLLENTGFKTTTNNTGGFQLNGVPAGSFTLQASLAGYQAASLSIQTAAGQTLTVGPIGLAPIPTTANLSGTIQNNSGQLLQNVIVTAGSASTLTDANGNYLLTGIAPGTATVTASLSGYQTVSTSVSFSAGVTYRFSPTLYPSSVPPPATTLQGIVVDGSSGNPISGASVVLKGVTQTTDAAGKFVFASVAAGAFTLSVSATGYQGAVVSGSIVAGLNDLGKLSLMPAPATTTLQGSVLSDQGSTIAGATVAITGGPSTTSDSAGHYQLAGIGSTQFSVQISATGYVAQSFAVSVSAPGSYSQDFHLVAQQANAMTLGPLTIAPQSAGANADISVTSTLVNGGSAEFDGILLLVVRDPSNNVIGSVPLTNAAGFSIGAITMAAGSSMGIVGHWNTGQFAPGAYQFELRLVQPGSVQRSNPLGTLIVNQLGNVSITATTHFSGTVTGDPPLVQAGLNQSIHITAVEKNDGNVTLPGQTFTLTVSDATGNVAYTATATTTGQGSNAIANLDFGSWLPVNGGNYQMSVVAADPSLGKIAGTLYVGNVAQAAFTVNPSSVVAGARTVHGNIHVTGVNPAQATVTDPLAPLIKTAIQKADTFNDAAASTWVQNNRCTSCHIANQALIGGELTRSLATYNAYQRNTILNVVSLNQAPDGGLTQGYCCSYYRRLTTMNLWGLTGYHNLQEFAAVIKHAADWVVGFQSSNGDWSSDYNSAWFDSDISMVTLNISSLSRADNLFKANSINTVPVYSEPALLASQPSSSRAFVTASASGNLYYTDANGGSVNLVAPDGTLITRWSGFNDPRCVVERGDGQVWLSTGGGTYKLNADGTSAQLAAGNFDSLSVGPDGTTVWGVVWGDKTIYQLDASGNAVAWLPNTASNPFSLIARITPDSDGSLYVTDYNAATIYHVLPDKSVKAVVPVLQGSQSPPGIIHLLKDGDHWLLSTLNGIYRFSSAWEGQRIYWGGRVDQMARLTDGRVIFAAYGQAGIRQLVPGTEAVAPSLPKYEAAISSATTWLQGQSLGSNDTLHLAQQLWGLGEAYRFYATTDTARAAAIQTAMNTLATQLRANQNSDGGWGRYSGYSSDALVTAQVGIALDYTNPSATDPAIRKAVAWLLTQQQGDGSWYSSNGIMSTHESTTTMVAIWLPTILDRLGSIDAQVTVAFPPNSQPAKYQPAPDKTTTDSSGNIVNTWLLQGVTNSGRDLDFDLTMPNLQPNEVRPAAVNAYMTFDNSFTQQAINVPIAIPNVTVTPPVSLTVATDQPAYAANATAQVTTTLVNVDNVQVTGNLLVTVYDPSGALVGTVTQQDVAIPAGGSLPVSGPFAIGTIPPLTYTVKAVLNNGGVTLAQGQTTFDVLPNNAGATATSTVHTDKGSYNASDTVQILSGVQSLSSNVTLSNATLNVAVFDASGASQFTHSYAVAQLLPSQTLSYQVPETLTNAAPGVYTVKQDLRDAQSNLLNHVETTYTVTSSSDTGFGLVGTIAATPKSLPVGATLTLTAAASNHGNAALTNLPLTITIVDPSTGTALQQFSQTSTVATGSTVPFNTSWITQGQTGVTYQAVLTATVGSGSSAKTLTLATDTFQLTIHLDATVTLSVGSPSLAALVLIDPSAVSGPMPARVTAALTALNYATTIVSTAQDFAGGVRSGAYQAYLLLGTQTQPDATTQRLLLEAVHRGEGLLSANGASTLPPSLAQALGLAASTTLPVINAQSIDIASTAPGGAAHVTLSPSLASRIVVPTTAQTQATLTGRLPSVPDQGTLSSEVAAQGRVDLGYYGSDAGTNGTHLALTSMGRLLNPDGTAAYTVWRIRNSGTAAASLTLAATDGTYRLAFTSPSQTDTYLASPDVAGTAAHQLVQGSQTIDTQTALTTTFGDTTPVEVGDNPGAIALWANRIGSTGVFAWSGAQHTLHGAIHSNSDLTLSGAQNLLDGPVHYVTAFSNSGSQNTFTFPPRQVATQPLPTLTNLNDYAPGGKVQQQAGANYYDETSECASKKTWSRHPNDMPLATGVYWIPCDVHLTGKGAGGTVTLVSTGEIAIDGSSGSFQPYYQGLQLATTASEASAIQLAGSGSQFGGWIYAPQGAVQISGSSMGFQCSIIADQIRLAGAKTQIDARQCAYATVQKQAPAVLWNGYGTGWAGYSAFDWQGAIGAYEATPGALTQLFDGTLAKIAPTSLALRSGSIVPLRLSVQNNGDAFTGQLGMAASDDSMFTPASWALSFSGKTVFTTTGTVRLGSGSGTVITATARAATPIVVDALSRATATVAHAPGDTLAGLIAAVQGISNPDTPLANALTALQAAQTSAAGGDSEGTLGHLLDAAADCAASANAQADALRTRIDWVIWAGTH